MAVGPIAPPTIQLHFDLHSVISISKAPSPSLLQVEAGCIFFFIQFFLTLQFHKIILFCFHKMLCGLPDSLLATEKRE